MSKVPVSVPPDAVAYDRDIGPLHDRLGSAVLTGEMSRLYSAGFWLLPLGLKREPLLLFKDKAGRPMKRHPLSIVVQKLVLAGSSNYAIRLNGILVVDIDTDTPEAREYVRERFGESTVQVKSPRGVHHYFHFTGEAPPAVRHDGIQIDFKTGPQSLIAGPFAERDDGGRYYPLAGQLVAVDALPPFVDRHEPVAKKTERASTSSAWAVLVGGRNKALWSKAVALVSYSDTYEQLFEELCVYRNSHFEDPQSVPDSEIAKVANWAFQKHQKGSIFKGRSSGVIIPRSSIDKLAARGEGLACLLYSVIMSDLGHKSGYEFSIVPDALRNSGKIKAGRRQIYQAVQVLLDEGLIEVTFQADKPKVPHRYRLVRLGQGEAEKGFNSYIGTLKGHTGFTVYEGGRT